MLSFARRGGTVLAGMACLALGLTACGGSGGATEGSADRTAASSSASASHTAAYQPATAQHPARNVPKPTMPAGADQETFAGAQAFMKYFQDCDNYMIQTGKGQCMTEIVDRSNKASAKLVNDLRKGYEEGDWIQGGFTHYSIESGRTFAKTQGIYSLYLYQSQDQGIHRGENGKIVEQITEFNSSRQPQEIWLKFKNGKWYMVHIANIPGTDYEG